MDFDVTDNDSDTDSVAELEYKTWDDACAWEFRNAPGNIFDELIRNTDGIRMMMNLWRDLDRGDM